MTALDTAFRNVSPRLNPRPTPAASVLITTAVVAFWIVLFGATFTSGGLLAWSVGVAYIGYDSALLVFVAIQSLSLLLAARSHFATESRRPSVGVIVAAHNEAPVLAATLDALLGQQDPPDQIWLADDGSSDPSAGVLWSRYGLETPAMGAVGAPSVSTPSLRWLRLSHQGKARALNAALPLVETDVVITVDADTLLEPDAIGVVRAAFAADPDLVVGGGVLTPHCDSSFAGRVLQEFQTYEYVRNFLARHAWSRLDCLLLISGAFAAFRRDAVLAVGGFDPECWVEDYELIHRLQRYARDRGLTWRVRILGRALARTDAPAHILPFLRQRRRWFAGFLQTQYWNRDMTGSPRFGALGLAMMPIKAVDTLQPLYGLTAIALLATFLLTGRLSVFLPASGVMVAKILLDLVNAVGSVAIYRRWTGDARTLGLGRALLFIVLEPFSFQILRHLGAAWGWIAMAQGRLTWGRPARGAGMVGEGLAPEGATTETMGG